MFVGLDLIGVNELPHVLEHTIAEFFEVLSELEGVKINQRNNFSPGLHDFIWDLCKLRVVLLQNEHTGVHNLPKVVLVEVRELLLRDDRLNDVKG